MTGLRRLICSCALATGMSALSASAALATTFYVNGSTGKDTNACTASETPCKTIGAAVTKSEAVPDIATIEVAAGEYVEPIGLGQPADSGITINGAGSGAGGTEVVGPSGAKNPTVGIGIPGGAITLSNFSVVNQSGDTEKGIVAGAEVTLNNVVVDMRNAGEANGIEAGEFGSLSMKGGGVTMESGTKGKAIFAQLNPLTINSAMITVANGSNAGGIESLFSPTSISNTAVSLGNTAERAAILTGLGAASLTNVEVIQGSSKSNGAGIVFELPTPLSLNGVNVTMTNAASKAAAVLQLLGTGTYEHLDVGGAWIGPAFETEGGNITLKDGRLIESSASVSPAFLYAGAGEGPGLFIQRSVIQASAAAVPGALTALNANVTVDSSELLGGHNGVWFEHDAGKIRTLTIAGSTIDAGNLGEADGAGVSGVRVTAANTNSIANANVEGSILLEPQTASVGAGGQSATITCTNSDAPNQNQIAKGTEGTIACASGTSGDASSTPASLFTTPITSYQLNLTSSAIDSVPAGAILLPFGLSPSATDLAGNPRVVDANGDCVAVQDKGALELQGHSVSCPTVAPSTSQSPKPVAGVITALTITPNAFFAAPSGATISKTKGKTKKKYGATISYRDSQAATTTFTVLREVSGRKQGRSCKKPGKSNRHGKRCTILTVIGSFTHADKAGANSLHFSGRLKGRKLVKGAYKLRAVPHNAAGNGTTVSRSFTIK
jgi:hypothetical protein